MKSMVLLAPMFQLGSARVRPSDTVLAAAVDNELVLLDTRSGSYFGLNKTGARIWQRLTEGMPVSDLARDLAATWGVSMDVAERDTEHLLAELASRQLVAAVDENGETES